MEIFIKIVLRNCDMGVGLEAAVAKMNEEETKVQISSCQQESSLVIEMNEEEIRTQISSCQQESSLEILAKESTDKPLFEAIADKLEDVFNYVTNSIKSFYTSAVVSIKHYFNPPAIEDDYIEYEAKKEKSSEESEQDIVKDAANDAIFKTNNLSNDQKRKFGLKLKMMGSVAAGNYLSLYGALNGMSCSDVDFGVWAI